MSVFQTRVAGTAVGRVGAQPVPAYFAIRNSLNASIGYAARIGLRRKSDQATVWLYLSDIGLTTTRDDEELPDIRFQAFMTEFSYRRDTRARRLAGRSSFQGAELAFSLADQALKIDGTSYTRRSLFSTFAVDGIEVEVRQILDRWDTGLVVFNGIGRRWDGAANGVVTLALDGLRLLFEPPAQPATYAGTGDLEGLADIAGQRKPVALGRIAYARPPLVVPTEVLYQLHTDSSGGSAPIQAVTGVTAGGVPLNPVDTALGTGRVVDYPTLAALRAATIRPTGNDPNPPGTYDIEPGEYATCAAEGWLRLGDDPGGEVTVDMDGATFGGVWISKPGEIIDAFARLYGPQLTAAQIDSASLTTIDGQRGYTLGIFIREQRAEAVMDAICDSIEGAWGDSPEGRLTVGVITAPSDGAAVLTLTDPSIGDTTWTIEAMPEDVLPAVKELTLGYGRNWAAGISIQSEAEADVRERLEATHLLSVANNSVPEHPEAKTLRVNTLIAEKADADTHAAFLASLYSGDFAVVSLTASHKAQGAEPFSRIGLVNAEEDFEGVGRALSVSLQSDPPSAELTVLVNA